MCVEGLKIGIIKKRWGIGPFREPKIKEQEV